MSRTISRILSAVAVTILLVVAAFAQREYKGATGTIPTGTSISVRMAENLSSATSQPGDMFHGTLADEIVVNGKIIFPRGADVTGRVTDAKSSGRLSAPGVLELALTSLDASNVSAKVATEPLRMEGTSHTKSNTAKIGGGAAIGAVIGAIAGGGKGAAIGTVVGGAAGAGTAAATGKSEATVETEALLTFTTSIDVLSVARNGKSSTTEEVRSYNEDDVHVTPSAGPKATTPSPAAPAAKPATTATTASAATPATAPSAATASPEFSARDRRVLRTCLSGDNLSSANQDVPPELARQVQKNGTLPFALEKRVQPLPLACESQLPHLPNNMERVYLNRQVMLLDSEAKILDIYTLDEQ